MVLLLNLLPMALLAVGLGAAWYWRKWWLAVLTVALWLVYAMAQPSYLPKGQMERAEVPALPAHSDAPLQDRQPKPDPLSERDQRMREAVQNGLDFKP
jgi:hypothetical protein